MNRERWWGAWAPSLSCITEAEEETYMAEWESILGRRNSLC